MNEVLNENIIQNSLMEMFKLKMIIRMSFPPDDKTGKYVFDLSNSILSNINNNNLEELVYKVIGAVQKYIYQQ